MNDLEDPIITRMMRDGTLDDEDERTPVCPCCGEECETVYTGPDGEIFACDNCLKRHDAYDMKECFKED